MMGNNTSMLLRGILPFWHGYRYTC